MAECPFSSRRGFLGGVAGGALAASALGARPAAAGVPGRGPGVVAPKSDVAIPFYGPHQAGIATAQQTHTLFASFDVTSEKVADLRTLLEAWTLAAARLTRGEPVHADSDEALGLGARRLTLTFGFSPSLFTRTDGTERFGLGSRRPEALVDLPVFPGDQLDAARSGGDIGVQACCDDAQIAFHAIRQLSRIAENPELWRATGSTGVADSTGAAGSTGVAAAAYGGASAGATNGRHDAPAPVATLRWLQAGFVADAVPGTPPRNLLGFHDGTDNPDVAAPQERAGGKTFSNGTSDADVWVGSEGPTWMHGGTYLVVRKIRLVLDHWDRTSLDFQEQVIGRSKRTGAPLSGGGLHAPLDLDATGADGEPKIAENAHVRLGSVSASNGARISRRSYSYNDGLSLVAERWPPWRQALEYDAGLLFIAHQRDPRRGFIPMFAQMSKFDLLNQYATHVGSAIFAVPGGTADGSSLARALFA